ncbi:MAG: hypothetical protein ACYSYL_15525, partial [Planctomycetota bacterium]|jgi:alpha-amylase
MCTKYFADGDVHKYFNPYDSPYDSYINFMNVLNNLQSRCAKPALLNTKSITNKALISKKRLTEQATEGVFCPPLGGS